MQAEGAYTKLGTWAPTETDAEVIEMMADKDEEWDKSLEGKSEWINRPAQPPGLLRTGRGPMKEDACCPSIVVLQVSRKSAAAATWRVQGLNSVRIIMAWAQRHGPSAAWRCL